MLEELAIAPFEAHAVGRAFSPPLRVLDVPRREIGLREAGLIVEGRSGVVVDQGFPLRPGPAD
jgi:hypothetical protein